MSTDTPDDALPENVHGPFNVVAECADCEVAIPIGSADPQAIGRVYCPDCGQQTEYTTFDP